MAAKNQDLYANIAYMEVQESAINTLTWARLQLASSLMSEKAALIIHRADIQLDTNSTVLNGSADLLSMCVSVSDRITDIRDMSQPEILMSLAYQRNDYGAAASGVIAKTPEVLDFSSLPGSGIIVPADNLFVGVQGVGDAAVGTARVRIYYTVKALKNEEYWDLIEARRVMTT